MRRVNRSRTGKEPVQDALRAVCWSLPLLIIATAHASASENADRLLLHQLDLSIATPSGVTAAIAYTPTFSFFDHRLNAGIGGRFSSFFGSGSVVFPNGNPALIAAGARGTLTVGQPPSYALNLIFSFSVLPFPRLAAGTNHPLVRIRFIPAV